MLHSLVGRHRSPVIDTADPPMIALEMRDEVIVYPIYVVLVFNSFYYEFSTVFSWFFFSYLEKNDFQTNHPLLNIQDHFHRLPTRKNYTSILLKILLLITVFSFIDESSHLQVKWYIFILIRNVERSKILYQMTFEPEMY